MAFSLLPREDAYFDLFTEMTVKIQEAAAVLMELMGDTTGHHSPYAKRIKDIEHTCDQLMHKITTKLNKSFITPFDREDIYGLSVALDDICDYIDAAARAMAMFDIKQSSEYATHLSRIIQSLSAEIHAAVAMLHKPNGMNAHFVEIHRLENEADDVYFRAMGDLFKNSSNPVNIIKWKELYDILENATDRCESVANIIESIVLKHG
jgi:predicted phosphate transport protein (TIGR00153 family)